jgi:hypothetical protein
MRPELAVAFVAGLFGLIPVMVQIASTRAQRRDRMTRLNQLRAELELLERLSTLVEGKVSAGDEAAKPQTNLVISDSLSKLLDQYNKLSEIAPYGVVGAKPPSPRQFSFLRRAFLLYNPRTTSGWILHTLFYMLAIIFVTWFLFALIAFVPIPAALLVAALLDIPIGIALLIIQRNAARNAAQLDEPNA